MSVILFFAVLFILVLVHEWGHFIVAKKTGMRVDEFGIGFPPKVFSVKKGETEYTFNLLPIGGFVRIFGENAEDKENDVDTFRAFGSKSKWAQAAVLIAGVTMNILFAWFLFFIVFMIGVPTSVEESEASKDAALTVGAVIAESPAAAAGIPSGATIIGLSAGEDSDQILNFTSFSAFTEDHKDVPIDITYRVGDETQTVTLTSQMDVIEGESDKVAVGVELVLIENIRKPVHAAFIDSVKTTATSLVAITVGIGSLLYDALFFQADFSAVAGPVGIVGMVGDAADFGLTSLLMFTAFISLNLAVINLLPFPALDGGRLIMVAIEAIMKKPINPIWVARVNLTGFALLILLMVAVTFSDISKII